MSTASGPVQQQPRQYANADMRRGLPPRQSDVLPTPTAPEDRNIIVDIMAQLEGLRSTLVYIRNAPDADQYVFCTQKEGAAYALVWAKRRYVHVWLTDNWYDFSLLEDV